MSRFIKQPHIRAVPMSLFPTMGNLNEAMCFAQSKFPDSYKDEVYAVLMAFQNTLLLTLNK